MILFSDEEYQKIEELAALGFDLEKIAMYFEEDLVQLRLDFDAPKSKLKYHIDRGVLIADAEMGVKMLENAKGGNITSANQLKRHLQNVKVEEIKKRLFYGSE